MNFFRRLNQRTMILWSILLSLSLVFAQGATLHVHDMDHEHHTHHNHGHEVIDSAHPAEHSHASKAHFSLDASHNDHHDDITSEVDVSPNGLLKASSAHVLFFAIIAFSLLLTLPARVGQAVRYRGDSDLFHYHCYLFSPPLRAPPL